MQYPLLPNLLLDKGRYRIIRQLGNGGFSITYLAEDTRMKRYIVIKEFFPVEARREGNDVIPAGCWTSWAYWNLTPDTYKRLQAGPSPFEKYRADLIREAQQTASLKHPNIAVAHDYFEVNNTVYLVMEYIEGKSLAQYVKDHGPLSVDEIIPILLSIGSALRYAHQEGIIHRDVTPNNIQWERLTGKYYLIDFGLARPFDEQDRQTLTKFGTTGYSSPEQDTSEKQGPFSDVYSLAASTYFFATGHPPLKTTAPNDNDRFQLILPREYCPDLPEWFEKAILEGMKRSPSERPATIAAFLGLFTPEERLPLTKSSEPDILSDIEVNTEALDTGESKLPDVELVPEMIREASVPPLVTPLPEATGKKTIEMPTILKPHLAQLLQQPITRPVPQSPFVQNRGRIILFGITFLCLLYVSFFCRVRVPTPLPLRTYQAEMNTETVHSSQTYIPKMPSRISGHADGLNTSFGTVATSLHPILSPTLSAPAELHVSRPKPVIYSRVVPSPSSTALAAILTFAQEDQVESSGNHSVYKMADVTDNNGAPYRLPLSQIWAPPNTTFTGSATLNVTLENKGNSTVELVTGTSDKELDKYLLQFASFWQWVAITVDGEPVKSKVVIKVMFHTTATPSETAK